MSTLTPKLLLRDSLMVLGALVVASGVWGGLGWALGSAAGGALALVNLFLLHRLTQRAAAGVESGPILAGLGVKSLVNVALLFVLLNFLVAPAVMVGVGAVVLAASLRGAVDLFRVPEEA